MQCAQQPREGDMQAMAAGRDGGSRCSPEKLDARLCEGRESSSALAYSPLEPLGRLSSTSPRSAMLPVAARFGLSADHLFSNAPVSLLPRRPKLPRRSVRHWVGNRSTPSRVLI